MDLHLDDDTFVRAPAARVYRAVADVAGWPRWWRGCEVLALGPATPDRWAVRLGPPWRRGVRLAVRAHGHRPDVGVHLELDGDLVGRAEFWLEPVGGGVVVHHLLVARAPGARPVRTLRRYRTAVRHGLWGLKDRIQTAVRVEAGLHP